MIAIKPVGAVVGALESQGTHPGPRNLEKDL